MLFTWDTKNLCLIFRWWHIRTTPGLFLSLLAVVAVTAGYEALRQASRRYESWVEKKQDEVPSKLPKHPVSLLPPLLPNSALPEIQTMQITIFFTFAFLFLFVCPLVCLFACQFPLQSPAMNRNAEIQCVLEPLLRTRLSYGQDETRSRLAEGHMSSNPCYMRSKPFMPSCSCEYSKILPVY